MDHDTIGWLYSLPRFGIKLGLGPISTLLGALGHPERTFPCLLVGGTNGKGSVAAMLDSMLGAGGLASGLYTSPHLVRPNERVRIAGRDIGDADLCRHLDTVRRTEERLVAQGRLGTHPSFFEVMTAAGLLAFREAHVDAAVLEVGLGGRLDATNVVDALVSVIVTIDLDHTDRLGTTIPEIAAEKAGIVKKRRPLVSGVAQDDAVSVLRGACDAAGASLLDARTTTRVTEAGDGSFDLDTPGGVYRKLRVPLPGHHQIENARVAVLALEAFARGIGRGVDPEAVRAGLRSVRWRGRLEWLPGDPPTLLDGAHNPAGAALLAGYLRREGRGSPVLVFGATSGKDAAGIVAPLGGLVKAVVLTRAPVDRAADPALLAPLVEPSCPRCEVVPNVAAALERARDLARDGGFVLVAGSLYLVGAVLGIVEGGDPPGPVAS